MYIYILCMCLCIIIQWHRCKTYTYMTPPITGDTQTLHQHGEIHRFFSAFVDQGPRSRKWMVHGYTPNWCNFQKTDVISGRHGRHKSSDHVPINTSIEKRDFPLWFREAIPGIPHLLDPNCRIFGCGEAAVFPHTGRDDFQSGAGGLLLERGAH